MPAGLGRDVVWSLRSWRRTPGSALLVILALGLSGGALITLVTLLNALLWRPLPVARPDELVGIFGMDQRRPEWINVGMPAGVFTSVAERQQVFGLVAGEVSARSIVTIGSASQRLAVNGVTLDYFETLGLQPILGRGVERRDIDNAAAVATISFGTWQRQFGGDPNVIGQTFRLRGEPVTIVGVAPATFTGLEAGVPTDAWVPASLYPRLFRFPESALFFNVLVGRLRPGVTLEQARPQLESLWEEARQAAVADAAPAGRAGLLALQPRIESAARGFSQYGAYYRRPLMWLALSSFITIVLACANLSGLLLARWSAREADLAVQAALGASNTRLLLQVIGESLALSMIAVILSAPLALWSAKALTLLIWNQPEVLPLDLAPDQRVFGVMVLLAALVALSVSLLPAIRIWTSKLTLMDSTRGLSGRGVSRWGRRLAGAQVALSVPLLVTAWTLVANLNQLASIYTGLRPDGVVVATLATPGGINRTGDLETYFARVTSNLLAIPDVDAAALARGMPTVIGTPNRRPVTGDDGVRAEPFVEAVSPGYFDTLAIPLLAGRDFRWTDAGDTGDVAVVSAELAKTLFGNADPVGQRLQLGEQTDDRVEIIGVAADANLADPHQANQLFLFTALLQQPQRLLEGGSPSVVLRSRLTAAGIRPLAEGAVSTLGQDQFIEPRPLQQIIDVTLLRERVMRLGAVYFAGLATLLTFVGLYAVLHLGVIRRIPEIGVRVALGASARDIRTLVAREALFVTTAGLMVGIPCAFVAGRLVARALTSAGAQDAFAFFAAIVLMLIVSVLSVLLPIRRATRVTPVDALRSE